MIAGFGRFRYHVLHAQPIQQVAGKLTAALWIAIGGNAVAGHHGPDPQAGSDNQGQQADTEKNEMHEFADPPDAPA